MTSVIDSHWITTALSIGAVLACFLILGFSEAFCSAVIVAFSPARNPLNFASVSLALVLNRKSLPLYWHFRVFCTFLRESFWTPSDLPQDAVFRSSFRTGMQTPLLDCDFLGHKSNSTYFADLDIARIQHFSRLMRYGIRSAKPLELAAAEAQQRRISSSDKNPPPTNTPKNALFAMTGRGDMMWALGGVSTHFRRPIEPYQSYDIQTRILSWDDKWIYVVSHFIKSGVETVHTDKDPSSDHVFASSIARVVIKKGRLTLPPEVVLSSQNLLPSRSSPADEKLHETVDSQWNWDVIERKRQAGLRLAQAFDLLGQPEQGLPDAIETRCDSMSTSGDL